jgi:YcxB-like protein
MNNDQTVPFIFSFTYSFSEWIRILREAEVRNLRYWFNQLLGLLFLLIGIYEIVLGIWLLKLPDPTAWRDGIWNILYGVLIVIFILVALLDLVTLYKLWLVSRRRKKIGPKIYEFEFDEQEARFTGRDSQGNEDVKLSWNHFSRVLLRKTAIILYLKDGGMWAIPRRVFTTAQSAQAFKQFVEFRIEESKVLANQNSG